MVGRSDRLDAFSDPTREVSLAAFQTHLNHKIGHELFPYVLASFVSESDFLAGRVFLGR